MTRQLTLLDTAFVALLGRRTTPGYEPEAWLDGAPIYECGDNTNSLNFNDWLEGAPVIVAKS